MTLLELRDELRRIHGIPEPWRRRTALHVIASWLSKASPPQTNWLRNLLKVPKNLSLWDWCLQGQGDPLPLQQQGLPIKQDTAAA